MTELLAYCYDHSKGGDPFGLASEAALQVLLVTDLLITDY
jgi:hypothetical protein